MRPMLLSHIAAVVGGRLHGADLQVDAISTDTRELQPGDSRKVLFVALKGERFDAHDHLDKAEAAGARAVLVTREVAGVGMPQLVVHDPLAALAALAADEQRRCPAKVVAITGSNGKTTVKNLVAAILEGAGSVWATPGNRNNEIGMPLAVIDTPADTRYAVYEMGTGAPGDIAYLTAIAPPHVAVVTNVSAAHLERMGTVEAIADTKAAVYDDLRDGGVAVINADDAFAAHFVQRARPHRVLRYGLQHAADVTARHIDQHADGVDFRLCTPLGDVDIGLALPGRHNLCNALAAATVGLALGLDPDTIASGLSRARPVGGRMLQHRLPAGAVLVDDAYNANPGSLLAAIDWLAAQPGRAWLVLGDMRELGPQAAELHAACGRAAADAGIERLYAIGPLAAEAVRAFGEGGLLFDSHAALVAALRPALREDVRVLVKGSRGSAMDRVVNALLQEGETDDAA
ncbi:MAG: UDP-N-acetylmuramoyl-tripeptide--D-alanyl-D-alanine ligase [Pseudoxanthomonas suwonensis]|nr:UDP-N-acetylmuramoyl-tripeptide--D-alanyl-D-alanine ligase [Pseudoxanthomonas suwonensis]